MDIMKNSSKKFWLSPLLFIVCLVALVSTSIVPILRAVQSKATRLYPDDSTGFVKINEIFVYELPAESKSVPFGLRCYPSSPFLLGDSHSPIIATTMHNGQIVGITPDPANNVLLLPNSKVSVHITGSCYLPLRSLGDIELFEYPISQETFQVGESRYSQDELTGLISDYVDDEFPPDFFEQTPVP
jgi:hypothetical protein